MSHQLQPTLQPPRRMKKALRPAWIPSPWREWKVSTTGRDSAAGGGGSGGWGTGEHTWGLTWLWSKPWWQWRLQEIFICLLRNRDCILLDRTGVFVNRYQDLPDLRIRTLVFHQFLAALFMQTLHDLAA